MQEFRITDAFAVWITGLPASGKSTIAAKLITQLNARGVDVALLESDELRKIFTPHPRYDPEERDMFYRQMVYVGVLLTQHGVPVVFDATANRRVYRDWAREQISKFVEVYVECPLKTCMARDPKGIYRRAREGQAETVPGLQTTYEAPEKPEVVLHGDRDAPEEAARRIVAKLADSDYLSSVIPA
jgi:adenylylsulfate kinase